MLSQNYSWGLQRDWNLSAFAAVHKVDWTCLVDIFVLQILRSLKSYRKFEIDAYFLEAVVTALTTEIWMIQCCYFSMYLQDLSAHSWSTDL